jgi:predicted nucleotidyltransferase
MAHGRFIIMKNKDIYKKVKDTIDQEGTLLYLTLAGSRLFGTFLPNSDYDVKGIYLPTLKSCFLSNYKKQIRFKDEECDLDVTVFALQNFIKHVQKLNVNSLDMLFSKSNKEAVIYTDGVLFNRYFTIENIQKHILTNEMLNFIEYTYAHLDKYTVKIHRLNEVTKLRESIENILSRYLNVFDLRLKDIIDDIDFSDVKYISKKMPSLLDTDDDMMLVLTKLFPYRSKVGYVLNGLDSIESNYGKRVSDNKSVIDYKSLSHAYRSIYELYCLFTVGKIVFPLDIADYLLDIRKGKVELDDVVKATLKMIDRVNGIKTNFNDKIDVSFLENIILNYCWNKL